MPTLMFTVMFLASAPLFLLPTTLALSVRHPGSAAIVLIDVALWTLLYFDLGPILGSVNPGLLHFPLPGAVPGAALILIGWLFLLRYAISGTSGRRVPPETP